MSENSSNDFIQNDENYQRYDATGRLFALSSLTKSIIFVLFFLAISVPWSIVRDESLKSVKSLSSKRLLATASSYTMAIRNLFNRYEMSVEQLAGLAIRPQYVYCDAEHIDGFIQFGQTINQVLNPKPYRFYLAHNNTASCLLGFDSEDSEKFTLYMMTSYNETHDTVKLYTETDIDISNPNSGVVHQYIPINESDFRFQYDSNVTELSYWTSHAMNFGFRSDNRSLSYIYLSNWLDDSVMTSKGGMSILNTDLIEVYENLPAPKSVKWALLDENLGMIITREHGAIYPISGHNGALDYPRIANSSNPLWRKAGEYFDSLKVDETVLFEFDDEEYYLTKTIVQSNAKLPFNFLMLYCLQDAIDEALRPYNILLLIVLLVIGVVAFLQIYLQKKNKDHRDARLSRPRQAKTPEEEYIKTSNSGILGDVIYDLRKLELETPEEVMMNKLVDTACSNFAKTQNRIFSITNATPHTANCKFCHFLHGETYISNDNNLVHHHHHLLSARMLTNHFHQYQYVNLIAENEITKDLLFHDYREDEFGKDEISESVTNTNINSIPNFANMSMAQFHQPSSQPKPAAPDENVDPFKTWEILTLNRLPKTVDGQSTSKNSLAKQIMIEFIHFLNDKQLIFVDIDPDRLIEFCFEFTQNYCKMPLTTFERLKTLNYLFHLEYNVWIENKLDFFALLVLAMIKDIELFTNDEEREILKKEKKRREKLAKKREEREKRIRAEKQSSSNLPSLNDGLLANQGFGGMNFGGLNNTHNNVVFGGINDIQNNQPNNVVFGGINNIQNNQPNNVVFGGINSMQNGNQPNNNSDNIVFGGLNSVPNANQNNPDNIVFGGLNSVQNGNQPNNNPDNIVFGGLNSVQNTKQNNSDNIVFGGLSSMKNNPDNIVFGGLANAENNHNTPGNMIFGGINSMKNNTQPNQSNNNQNNIVFGGLSAMQNTQNQDIVCLEDNPENTTFGGISSMKKDNNKDIVADEQPQETESYESDNSKENVDESTDEFYRKFCFGLNDLFSVRRRQMDVFQVLLSKYYSFNNCSFNHVYLKQRIRRIFESCHVSKHFEIFGEFQNRIESPEFSVTNNSDDLDIFLRAVYVFLDYSCYWCDLDDFDNVFAEYNKKIFTEEELTNERFIWSYHYEIIDKLVEPFTQLFMTLCPIHQLKQKLIIIIQHMQNKQSEHGTFISDENVLEISSSSSKKEKEKKISHRFSRDKSSKESDGHAETTDDDS